MGYEACWFSTPDSDDSACSSARIVKSYEIALRNHSSCILHCHKVVACSADQVPFLRWTLRNPPQNPRLTPLRPKMSTMGEPCRSTRAFPTTCQRSCIAQSYVAEVSYSVRQSQRIRSGILLTIEGYDLGSIADMQAMPGFLAVSGFPDKTATFGHAIDPTVQQLINSLVSIGAFVSCAAIGPAGRVLSRRWTLLVGVLLNYLGVILMIVAKNPGQLYAGRLIIEFANGLFDALPQLYIHESAPSIQRGSLLGMFNVFIGVGLLIGSIANNVRPPQLPFPPCHCPCTSPCYC